MTKLFFDIETLPADEATEPIVRELFDRNPNRSATYEEYLHGTSLNGTFGRLFCISYARDDQPPKLIYGEESAQLQQFWQQVTRSDLLVGHSIVDFDLPFLLKRSIIHRVRPSLAAEELTTTNPQRIYDTKHAWDSWRGGAASGLDTLAKVFGYQTSKQGISGRQVYEFWQAGRLAEIYDYCQRDVALTRRIYRRLNFLPDDILTGTG